MIDSLRDRDEAERMALKIQNHWMKAGYPLTIVRVEEFARDLDGSPYFAIRSNLVNGLPPRKLELLAAA